MCYNTSITEPICYVCMCRIHAESMYPPLQLSEGVTNEYILSSYMWANIDDGDHVFISPDTCQLQIFISPDMRRLQVFISSNTRTQMKVSLIQSFVHQFLGSYINTPF